ncbi:hypothetical protein [Sulfurovum sp.]|uniref:hypothetical protein n=1 Tax=Sulfurovum sp. TaxID=1969726 RepID=UPI00356AFFE2
MKNAKAIFTENELDLAQDMLEEIKMFSPNSTYKIFHLSGNGILDNGKLFRKEYGGWVIATDSSAEYKAGFYRGFGDTKGMKRIFEATV